MSGLICMSWQLMNRKVHLASRYNRPLFAFTLNRQSNVYIVDSI